MASTDTTSHPSSPRPRPGPSPIVDLRDGHRGSRSGRGRAGPDLSDPCDVRRTHETLPRGKNRDDIEREPAVDSEVWLLHVRYQRTRCPDVFATLVAEYGGYAHALARRLYREGEPLEDLQQVAMEALVAALRRFDCDRSIPFPGFATPYIVGALKRHYRDHGWALRVPRSVHEVAAPARSAADRLSGVLGRSPTVTEVAAELGISEDDLLLAQSATRARSTVSLDGPPREDGTLPLELGARDARLDLAEGHLALSAAMEHLTDRERTVLGLYFYEELTQTQIAARYGVSQMQVSRWISTALGRLRSRMSPTADDPPAAHVA